ncbi:MAG: caspase family protein, partial [Alphaproteobacteria bacterium]|nr:caspase family protein [Alphaproteobacteria bacterium]
MRPAVLSALLSVIAALAILLGGLPAIAQPARAPAGSEKRIALVIGNSNYKGAPLKNPVNDARAMAAALQGLGFEVIKRENAGQRDMNQAITEFANKLQTSNGVGLFYYAGHGMQVKGRNYLLPVDAEAKSEIGIRNETIDVDQILDGLASASNPLNVVILDACRNNPFERSFRGNSGGLAQVDAPKGALIAYATAPGKVAADGDGTNGLYTAELLRALNEPNLRIEEVFKHVRSRVAAATNDLQVPWEASSLVGDFYFRIVADDTAIELAFWQSIQNSTDPRDFQSYLEQFPRGRFAALARNRAGAAAVAAAPPPSPSVPP